MRKVKGWEVNFAKIFELFMLPCYAIVMLSTAKKPHSLLTSIETHSASSLRSA